jgi:hypothetical protein
MACRHPAGTTAPPPPAIPHPPRRRPRWTARARSPSRTVADAHAAPPAAGQATASAAFLSPQQPNPVVVPSTPPLLGVLRRPVESAQYTSLAFGRRLRETGLVASMGTVGDALDNAVAESFFATLECELLDRYDWPTRQALRTAVFDFIEVFYNRQRRHSTLAYQTPLDYEHQHPSPASAA